MYNTYIALFSSVSTILYHYYFPPFDQLNWKLTENMLISQSWGKNQLTLGWPFEQSNIYCLLSEGVIFSSDYM